MNDIINNIIERRSVRNYTEEKVSREVLERLLNVAVWSPNAGNRQRTRIIICQDNELNVRLGRAQNVVYGQFNSGRLFYRRFWKRNPDKMEYPRGLSHQRTRYTRLSLRELSGTEGTKVSGTPVCLIRILLVIIELTRRPLR